MPAVKGLFREQEASEQAPEAVVVRQFVRKYSEVLWCAGDGVGLAGCDTPGGMRDQRRVIIFAVLRDWGGFGAGGDGCGPVAAGCVGCRAGGEPAAGGVDREASGGERPAARGQRPAACP